MTTITSTSTTTTQSTVAEIPTADLITAIRGLVEGAGGTWPDFGAGENDSAVFQLSDGLGNSIYIDHTSTGTHVVSLTDRETV